MDVIRNVAVQEVSRRDGSYPLSVPAATAAFFGGSPFRPSVVFPSRPAPREKFQNDHVPMDERDEAQTGIPSDAPVRGGANSARNSVAGAAARVAFERPYTSRRNQLVLRGMRGRWRDGFSRKSWAPSFRSVPRTGSDFVLSDILARVGVRVPGCPPRSRGELATPVRESPSAMRTRVVHQGHGGFERARDFASRCDSTLAELSTLATGRAY